MAVSTASAAVDVFDTNTSYQDESLVVVETFINNTDASATLSPVNWSIDFGDGSIWDSKNNFTLSAGESATVLAKHNYSAVGNYNVTVYAWNSSVDGAQSDSDSFTVRVEGPPTFDQTLENQNVTVLEPFTLQVNCSDPNSDTVSYSTNDTVLPIDSSTGLISKTFSDSEVGNYSVQVTCADALSSTSQVIALAPKKSPDIVLSSTSMIFSDSNPYPDETITINQTIINNGTGVAANFNVDFYEGANQSNLLGQVSSGGALQPGESRVVQFTYTVGDTGVYLIRAVVDPLNKETVVNNNNASRLLPVGNVNIGDIVVEPSVSSPKYVGQTVSITGNAWYNTTYLPGEGNDVAGGTVSISLQWYNASDDDIVILNQWTVYTLADGTFSKSFTAPLQSDTYNVSINVQDGTFSKTEVRELQVNDYPVEEQPDYDFIVTVGVNNSGPIYDVDKVNITATILNLGALEATNTDLTIYAAGQVLTTFNGLTIPADGASTITRYVEWAPDASEYGWQVVSASATNGQDSASDSVNVRVYNSSPDIATVSLTLSDYTPAAGQSISINRIVRNLEGGVSGDFNVTVYEGPNGDSPIQTDFVSSLQGKGVEGNSVSLAWQEDLPTTHIIRVAADVDNDIVNEHSEANNGLNITVTVHEPCPELEVQSITFNDSNPDNGTNINITVTVRNVGDADADSATVVIYNDSTLLATRTLGGILIDGTNTSDLTEWYASPPGWHTIKARVENDPSCIANHTRNQNIYVNAPDGTDLLTLSEYISFSNEYPERDELVNAQVVIMNNHTTENATNVTVEFWSDKGEPVVQDYYGQQTIPFLRYKTNVTLNLTFSSTLVGSHVFTAIIDPQGDVDEVTKQNNNATRAYVVVGEAEHNISSFVLLANDSSYKRSFEAIVTNLGLNNLSSITWGFNSNESAPTSGNTSFSLLPGDNVSLLVSYTYSAQGTYYPKVSFTNQGMTVSKTLNITV